MFSGFVIAALDAKEQRSRQTDNARQGFGLWFFAYLEYANLLLSITYGAWSL